MDSISMHGAIRTIALLGNHTPRQCGIATFTADLTDALRVSSSQLDCFVVAMNDLGKQYAYPEQVRFQVAQADVASYYRAADFLNVNNVDVVSVQHEYGIFGGPAGAHLLTLLRALRMPIVTTMHTILPAPSAWQRSVTAQLCALSERVVVMSNNGRELLSDGNGIDPHKIDLIPHGIPSLPNAARSKAKLGVDGKVVLLTFGLLSPDKGIEFVIDALPAIMKQCPELVYIVLGATHPHVKEQHGEAYREMLKSRGHRLAVDNHLVFQDRFVSHAELTQTLSAADIYITPYLNAEQITSGTLAYAVGCGKTVISTPYRYARELLADGRGILVPWRDSGAIAAEVISLLRDRARRTELERRAASLGRGMTWPVVANSYLQTCERAVSEHRARARASRSASQSVKRPAALAEGNFCQVADTLTQPLCSTLDNRSALRK